MPGKSLTPFQVLSRLPEDATPTGSSSIETLEDGVLCSELFRQHRDEIDGIILQIQQKHCDHLFFLDAETYFSSNLQFTAIREVGKKYVKEVLSRSLYNKDTKKVSYPDGWVSKFGLGEYFAVRILHEQACIDLLYDQRGNAIPEKMDQMLREIDMGICEGADRNVDSNSINGIGPTKGDRID